MLGGALSPIDGIDPEDLKLKELGDRVTRATASREVVVATNATTTGEATALYIADMLRERAPEVTVTRLASGLPVGADLEYADEITLGKALRGRQALYAPLDDQAVVLLRRQRRAAAPGRSARARSRPRWTALSTAFIAASWSPRGPEIQTQVDARVERLDGGVGDRSRSR